MCEPAGPDCELEALIGQEVILDVKAPVLYIGILKSVGPNVVVLGDADVHFCEDSQSTTELYLLGTRQTGRRPNRAAVYVMRNEVVSISRLEDVIDY